LIGPVLWSSLSPPLGRPRLRSVTRWEVAVWLLAMSSIVPAPTRDGDTVTRLGAIAALTVIAAGGRGPLVNFPSSPQPAAPTPNATKAATAAHGILRCASTGLTILVTTPGNLPEGP
jgi:hypothetical protein